ncbi:hypothetical protein [Haliscomenobacter hydrossis]|uniref:Uncharacterized protein n=1 Tax=Haliscomenobacter hydrossis (strain ATCC 27775 / DSM 1100 / LMG 10767 / O) TaxID=760192 RepID=F4KQJ3_HALH1|nr:hypothetical protein [Haliscomenobacter hydrossis]AEE49982.1 hypothetical protein Halhy_2097 [Haliscomenobacter hydrossis DSM 1100]
MKKPILFVLCCIFIGQQAVLGQFYMFEKLSPKEVETIKERKLIVLLAEPTPADISYYRYRRQKDEIVKLEKLCDAFNEAVKQAIAARWTMHKDVKFTNLEGYKKNYAKEGKQYVVMHFSNLDYSMSTSFRIKLDTSGKKGYETLLCNNFVAFSKGEKSLKSTIHYLMLPEVIPGELSAHFIMGVNEFLFRKVLEKDEKLTRSEMSEAILKGKAKLSNKTLLICKDWVLSSLDEATIKSMYPYPVKVVNKEEFVEAIRSKSADFVWHMAGSINERRSSSISSHVYRSLAFVHFLIDNATGEPLVMMHPYMYAPIFNFFKNRTDHVLNKQILERIVDMAKE